MVDATASRGESREDIGGVSERWGKQGRAVGERVWWGVGWGACHGEWETIGKEEVSWGRDIKELILSRVERLLEWMS